MRPAVLDDSESHEYGGAATGFVVAILLLVVIGVAAFFYYGGDAEVKIKQPNVSVSASPEPS
jgi:hypothetical protein